MNEWISTEISLTPGTDLDLFRIGNDMLPLIPFDRIRVSGIRIHRLDGSQGPLTGAQAPLGALIVSLPIPVRELQSQS